MHTCVRTYVLIHTYDTYINIYHTHTHARTHARTHAHTYVWKYLYMKCLIYDVVILRSNICIIYKSHVFKPF